MVCYYIFKELQLLKLKYNISFTQIHVICGLKTQSHVFFCSRGVFKHKNKDLKPNLTQDDLYIKARNSHFCVLL